MRSDTSKLKTISEPRCWELLDQKSIGRLAVAVTNHPDIFPVNYAVRHRQIVIQTAAGQKLAAAVLGTSVAFEVDAIDEEAKTGWSIVVKGEATEPRRLEDYLSAEDLEIGPWAGGTRDRYIIIEPHRVTGRQIPPG